MVKTFERCAWALTFALLSACGSKEEPKAPPTASAPTPAPTAQATTPRATPQGTPAPNFGGATKVSREVEAIGSTPEAAIVSALQSAAEQVNGVRVASQFQSMRAGLDMSVNGTQIQSARAEAFTQKIVAASQGAITGFEILGQEEIHQLDEETINKVRASDAGYSYKASASSEGAVSVDAQSDTRLRAGNASASDSSSFSGSASYNDRASVNVNRGATSYASDTHHKKMRSYWKVKVRADVAQYRAPDEKGRPKIVVAMPKTMVGSFAVGDNKVGANDVARSVRAQLSDILTQTKRFIVLDREFGDELQAEIDHINSGNVRVQDSARIGQQLATDLILIPTIERFEYLRHTRQLRMSDRELTSYSGGGRITLRLINAATGEVIMSDSFDHKLASADPSTMPRVIDGKSMAAQMMDSLSGQIGGAIVTEIFPVSVVSLNGDQVVLSQGGDSLQVGQRWEAVLLGDELKDPQTGLSLGRAETPVGAIRIDRVSTQTSYGTVEGNSNIGAAPFRPGSIELRKKLPTTGVAQNKASTSRTDATPLGNTALSESAPLPVRKAALQPRRVTEEESSGSMSSVGEKSSSRDDKW